MCEELALSPCENSCPLHMNIPRFLQLYKEKRLEDAFLSVLLDNPLPASTGRVCQHPCDSRCRRQTIDQAVNMREVHRFIADSIFNSESIRARWCKRMRSRKLDATGARSRSSARDRPAYRGLLSGHARHDVTVFDSKSEAGGMLRFALPEYRLTEVCAAARDRTDRAARREVRVQHPSRIRFAAE